MKSLLNDVANFFNKQGRLIQIILLFIPVINWVMEVCVRWSTYFKTKSLIMLVIAIIVTLPLGLIVGWLDMLWCLLFNRLILTKK